MYGLRAEFLDYIIVEKGLSKNTVDAYSRDLSRFELFLKDRQKTIKAELEWVRSNAKGRHAKSKARLKCFDELNSADFQHRESAVLGQLRYRNR